MAKITNVFAVYMPDWEIAEIPVKEALLLIRGGKTIHDLINYVPSEITRPLVFFVTKEAANKFIELCRA